MAHKFCFEALDKSLRDIIRGRSSSNAVFGGKVMVEIFDRFYLSFLEAAAQTLFMQQ